MGSPGKGATYRTAEQIRTMLQAHGDVEFDYLMFKDISHSRRCLF